MKRYQCGRILFIFITLGALFFGTVAGVVHAKQPIHMEILFMNHGPMQPTIRNLQALLQKYAGQVKASWFDYEKASGKAFRKRHGITQHIPLLIYINGQPTFDVGGKRLTFAGFPSGAGPYRFQGKWTFQDLERVIQSLAGEKLY
jgi:hypothetical protein